MYESIPFDPECDPYSPAEEFALAADLLAYFEGDLKEKSPRMLAAAERGRKAKAEYKAWLRQENQKPSTT